MRNLSIDDFPALARHVREYEAMPKEERERIEREREEESTRREIERHRAQVKSDMMKKSGLGQKFLKRTFETFEVNEANRAACHYFLNFARDFEAQKKGIYIWGPYGTGKTHLAAAVANHLLNEGKRVLFLPVNMLKERVYASYRDHTTNEIIAEVCGKALLILDDFDKLSATDNMKELLYGIINRLYEQEKLVIITANASRAALEKLYDGSIASRIAEMCHCAQLMGPDRRVTAREVLL